MDSDALHVVKMFTHEQVSTKSQKETNLKNDDNVCEECDIKLNLMGIAAAEMKISLLCESMDQHQKV